jgi:NAD(P)-dependent dehydrogenase (short-subunit alcohol dehydrogenase family)
MTDSPKAALITGGSRGIGRGIALALAREHFACMVNYASNVAAAEEVKRLIESHGGRTAIVQADISNADDRRRLADGAYAAFGRLDLLVNNAGVAPSVRADILEATEESFDRLININLKGPYFLTQLIASRMIEQVQRGRIHAPKVVNITSVSAYAASTNRGDYCIAKAGLAMMTQLYAARLAEFGINVYEVRPGIIETDMTGPVKAKYDKLIFEGDLAPIKRWGKPEDVARAVVAIATDLLPFSTGQVIDVAGGFHLRRL